MNRSNEPASLQALMHGRFELFGSTVADGRPNLRDFGPTPGGTGEMRRNEARKQQVKASKKRVRKDEADAGAEHVDAAAPYRAILGKGRDYARNGADYIRETRPAEYLAFPHLGPDEFQSAVQARASIIATPAHFNPSLSGQSQPYPWRAHHLIPGEAFYTEDATGRPIFDKPENFDVLLQTPYDVDHGHNIILLPSIAWAVPVHALLQHPNNHNGYTRSVIRSLKKIDDTIDGLRGRAKPHEALVANLFEELRRLESELWDDLIEESRSAVRAAASGHLYAGPWCRWKTQEGKEYVWPALW